jgi:hypothetical protein
MDNLVVVVVSAITAAVVSGLGAMIQTALALRTKVDESLRADRMAAYKVLWKKMELLPMWPRATDVTYQELDDLSKEFRDWYFSQGGFLLSAKAQKAYGKMQQQICDAVDEDASTKAPSVSEADYKAIRDRCSALRTELTRDLFSRRRAFLFSP